MPPAPDGFGSRPDRMWGGCAGALDDAGKRFCVNYYFFIPWSAMGRTDKPDRIGFNIGVQDDDGGGRRDHALYWTGNPRRPFSDESAFGILVLDP